LGYADSLSDDAEYLDAFHTAKLLASHGYAIVNGGGPGVMRASTLGAHEGGGHAIGVTFYPTDATHFEGRDQENPIDEEIVTNTYVERTVKILDTADVYVVFNGGTGTLSELGMAWGLARIHFGHHKHLILYGSYWHSIIEAIGSNLRLRPEELQVYHIVDSPQEVLDRIETIKLV
jgi:uncharacterized protein (TIGR00730 family)